MSSYCTLGGYRRQLADLSRPRFQTHRGCAAPFIDCGPRWKCRILPAHEVGEHESSDMQVNLTRKSSTCTTNSRSTHMCHEQAAQGLVTFGDHSRELARLEVQSSCARTMSSRLSFYRFSNPRYVPVNRLTKHSSVVYPYICSGTLGFSALHYVHLPGR